MASEGGGGCWALFLEDFPPPHLDAELAALVPQHSSVHLFLTTFEFHFFICSKVVLLKSVFDVFKILGWGMTERQLLVYAGLWEQYVQAIGIITVDRCLSYLFKLSPTTVLFTRKFQPLYLSLVTSTIEYSSEEQ